MKKNLFYVFLILSLSLTRCQKWEITKFNNTQQEIFNIYEVNDTFKLVNNGVDTLIYNVVFKDEGSSRIGFRESIQTGYVNIKSQNNSSLNISINSCESNDLPCVVVEFDSVKHMTYKTLNNINVNNKYYDKIYCFSDSLYISPVDGLVYIKTFKGDSYELI